jgi:hypothetical protein
MNKMIIYLIQNKCRLAKFFYLAAALIEQLPDLEKRITGTVIASRRPHGKRLAHK